MTMSCDYYVIITMVYVNLCKTLTYFKRVQNFEAKTAASCKNFPVKNIFTSNLTLKFLKKMFMIL